MIFLDTCVWIELVASKNPETPKEIRQATLASKLLTDIKSKNESIVTCKEQLIEVISAIQKYKMREYNRGCKTSSQPGVGSIKEFRSTSVFNQTQSLCRQACNDIIHMAKNINSNICGIDKILDNIHLVDINDCIYYEYCCNNGVDFYTFDGDFANLGANPRIHILS